MGKNVGRQEKKFNYHFQTIRADLSVQILYTMRLLPLPDSFHPAKEMLATLRDECKAAILRLSA